MYLLAIKMGAPLRSKGQSKQLDKRVGKRLQRSKSNVMFNNHFNTENEKIGKL